METVGENTSSTSSSPSDSGVTGRGARLVGLGLTAVFVVLNVVMFGIMLSTVSRYRRAIEMVPMSGTITDHALKDFNVVNAHDHIYKQSHLDKYLKAAERTGVTRTLFVASSARTILGRTGEKDAMNDENSREIMNMARQYPDKIIPFCTIYPRDPDKLEKVKGYVADGAKGLKLYSGHSSFHERPLDVDDMLPVYAYCERAGVPIVWHINLRRYRDEFRRVMERFPNLRVIVPHFGQAYWRPERELPWIAELIDTYPNLYTDTSLGTREILVGGLRSVSNNRDLFREFCTRYSDRILFGTDMVVTGNKEKTAEWIESVIRACRDMLEKDVYHFFMAARGSKYARPDADPYGTLRGLALDDDTLRKIYETNIEKLLPPE